jgi:hypothetical protein
MKVKRLLIRSFLTFAAFLLLVAIALLVVSSWNARVEVVDLPEFEEIDAEFLKKYPPNRVYTEEELAMKEREISRIFEMKMKALDKQEQRQRKTGTAIE